ncbi:ISAs1 family transposase [Nocardiopsis sp. CNT312]|uniref:ISAs1 family transposase n=1 Tax=Nocardiopsis sp. CNT312 TaxID=1137268 RepID=UPI0004B7D2EB|nr:ISAs1 family transposase [Nocardiopsis sp. CNT312]
MHPQSAMPSPALSAPAEEEADPRDRRGRRHRLGCIVLVCLCAVLAGARSLTAIGQWAANAPPRTLARLGARTTCPGLGVRTAPSTATIRRVLTSLDPAALTRMTTAADLAVLIIDGKSVRGSRTRRSQAVHLLAAMTPAGHVAAQIRVADKTSEIPALADVLDGLDIEGSVVSADALHTQTDTARHLVSERKAHYVFTVKGNQPTLFAQVKALPWAKAPALSTETDRAHGRVERRTVKVLTAPRIAFPHAAQVLRVHRWVKEAATGRVRRTYAYVITSLPAERADAARLAGLVRGHWRIEALHHVRDVSFGEDASRVRTGHGPQNMAMLRNLVIPLLAELGHTSIPEAVRWVSYEAFSRPLDLLGLA